jgi:hypothetical protein
LLLANGTVTEVSGLALSTLTLMRARSLPDLVDTEMIAWVIGMDTPAVPRDAEMRVRVDPAEVVRTRAGAGGRACVTATAAGATAGAAAGAGATGGVVVDATKGWDHAPAPTLLCARTENEYAVPARSPRTVQVVRVVEHRAASAPFADTTAV